MRGNVLLRYSLPLLIVLPIGFLFLYPQLIQCIRVSQSANFRPLTGMPTVYVHQAATSQQHKQLRQHVRTAQLRIKRFWGAQRGRAILIYCPEQADYEQYCAGGEGAGCSLGMPWGDSYLVMGPDGNNADVIAHELCHDELFTRLGWWRVKRQIPQWFNEGLALMVDYRFSNPTIWEHPDSSSRNRSEWPETRSMHIRPRPMLKLSDLETTHDFFGNNPTHTMLAYQTAADEVARWLSKVGRAGVPALSNAIANGDDFADAYHRLERGKKSQL
ncbi:hypothetical protein GCM10028808_44710 [Spirosoma migulaei]